jgi:predicted ATPase
MLIQGWILALRGEASEAVQMITSAITSWRSTGSQLWMPVWSAYLGRASAELGALEDASLRINEALSAIETTSQRWCEAEVNRIAGEIALMSSEPDVTKAEVYFDRALGVAREQQAKSWELRAAMSMARLWRDQGKRQQAHDLLAPVYGWFTGGFDTLDLKEAKALLDTLAA